MTTVLGGHDKIEFNFQFFLKINWQKLACYKNMDMQVNMSPKKPNKQKTLIKIRNRSKKFGQFAKL